MERFELKLVGAAGFRVATCKMVNPLTTLSIVCLYVETLLIAYVASRLDVQEQRTYFLLFVLVIAVSFVLTNTSSALMVKTSMDFSGRYIARVLCFSLHLCQLSLIWRFGKLVYLYDKKDWFELANLRLIHVAVQTLPFIALQGYLVLSTMPINAVSLLALSIAVVSASLSLTMFCVRDQLHACSWEDVAETRTSTTKRCCGVILYLLGTVLVLATRFACIILMTLVVSYYVFIPLGFHMMFLIFGYLSCKAVKSEAFTLRDVVVRVGLSYLNIFDLAETNMLTVQCKYVSFYTAILVENIVMIAVWLLGSEVDYITKLIVIVIILAVFICALVLKFTSCGFISISSGVQLISPETPDTPTVIASNKINNDTSPIPSISSAVPHVTENAIENADTSEGVAVDTSSRPPHTPRTHGYDLPETLADFRMRTDPRASDTDYGTYVTGTHDSVSVDDPTRVSRYASLDSALNKEHHRVVKPGHTPTSGLIAREARNRSDISLDIGSSNSRNTNTLVTSMMATSDTSAAQTPPGNRDTKRSTPHHKTTLWQKMNLRLPSVSTFLGRLDRIATFKENHIAKVVNTGTAGSSEKVVRDEPPPSIAINDQGLKRREVHREDPSLTDVTNSTAVCVGTPRTEVRTPHSHPAPCRRLTNEDRVNLWLANIYGSQPILDCQCSSSRSSDCTYVIPPSRAKHRGLLQFNQFLAQIPSHPEDSSVHQRTEIHVVPPAKPHRSLKPISKQLRASSEMNLNQINPKLEGEITVLPVNNISDLSVIPVHAASSAQSPHRMASDLELKKTLGAEYGQRLSKPRSHRRSSSESSESTAVFEFQQTRSPRGSRLRAKKDPIVPFIIKLSAMESLV